MPFNRPITIEKFDEQKEEWEIFLPTLHARINKTTVNNEYLSAGAVQAKRTLTFDLRYCPPLKEVGYNTQIYRILYDGMHFNIKDYDDYMENHTTIRLMGVSY